MYQTKSETVTSYWVNNNITQALTSLKDALENGPDNQPSITEHDDHYYLCIGKNMIDIFSGILPRGIKIIYPEDSFEMFGDSLAYIPLEELRPLAPHIDMIIKKFKLFEDNTEHAIERQDILLDKAEQMGKSIELNYYYVIGDIREKIKETMV